MRWLANKISWITAVTSLVTMLSVQTFHSPLSHCHDDCHHGVCSVEQPSPEACVQSKQKKTATCTHTHHHAGHVHVHTHEVPAEDSSNDSSAPSHDHGDHCHLCQFLTQAVQPVAALALLIGEDVVSIRPADLVPELVVIPLASPNVRGPPLA